MLKQIEYTASRTKLKLTAGAYSCAGVKEHNEDAFAINAPETPSRSTKGIVAVIADGVSHANQAAKASRYCVEQLSSSYFDAPKTWSTSRIILDVINQINTHLFNKKQPIESVQNDFRRPQWLTTLSGVIFRSATAHIFHVGDSQILLLRDGQLKKLTTPHHQKLANNNAILTRAIGADNHLKIDYQSIEIEADDLFIFTTDGVHEFVSEQDLIRLCDACQSEASQSTISQPKINRAEINRAEISQYENKEDLNKLSEKIIDLALSNSSQDNLTCMVAKVELVPHLQPDEIRSMLLNKAIPPALEAGQSIEGFKVIKNIHASSRSHLYLVEEIVSGNKFTLKVPSINFSEDEIYLQGFVREAWVGSQINHPTIMKVYPTKTGSQFHYHVCEFIEGQTLRQWMHDRPDPSLDEVRQIISQVIEALRIFKNLDVVHRDIKPENIMIDHQGQIKLIDYGTASIAALDEQVNLLKETHPLGTVNYIAPETLINLTSTHKSDLFSLGVMTYEMLTGHLPYTKLSSQSYKVGVKNESDKKPYEQYQYLPALEFRSDLPFWVDLALRRAVEANPDDRYDLYSEFMTDISRPNQRAESSFESQPFIERDPVKFWKVVSAILALTVLVLLINQ